MKIIEELAQDCATSLINAGTISVDIIRPYLQKAFDANASEQGSQALHEANSKLQ